MYEMCVAAATPATPQPETHALSPVPRKLLLRPHHQHVEELRPAPFRQQVDVPSCLGWGLWFLPSSLCTHLYLFVQSFQQLLP